MGKGGNSGQWGHGGEGGHGGKEGLGGQGDHVGQGGHGGQGDHSGQRGHGGAGGHIGDGGHGGVGWDGELFGKAVKVLLVQVDLSGMTIVESGQNCSLCIYTDNWAHFVTMPPSPQGMLSARWMSIH